MPAQFLHLIRYLSSHPEYDIFGISCESDTRYDTDALYQKKHHYHAIKLASSTHPYVLDFQKSILNAQAVFQILQKFKQQDIHFDLAISHTGWGEAIFFKAAYPKTPLIGYIEFFFHLQGADIGFDPHYPVTTDQQLQIKTLNAQLLLSMNECDAFITPTHWQKSLFPQLWQPKINVIHEGVDTSVCKPNEKVSFTLPCGTHLTRKDEVITYSARNLEPYRGFPVFLKAIERVCKERPNCHIIITGGDKVSYSPRLPNNESYREHFLKTVSLPHDRVHFLGTVPYQTHLQLLQLSSAHIYLTYPFVLSWSFIEAMACGCTIIASDTRPVMDFLEADINGISVNFFDDKQIATKINSILNHPERKKHLGQAARKKIDQHYQHHFSISHYLHLFQDLITKKNA